MLPFSNKQNKDNFRVNLNLLIWTKKIIVGNIISENLETFPSLDSTKQNEIESFGITKRNHDLDVQEDLSLSLSLSLSFLSLSLNLLKLLTLDLDLDLDVEHR